VTSIEHDKQGNTWIASEGHNIVKYVHKQKQYIDTGIGSQSISDILFDDNDLMWLATSHGLMKVDLQSAAFKSLTDRPITGSLSNDNRGNTWIGGNKFTRFDEETLSYVELPNILDFGITIAYDNNILFSDGASLSALDVDTFAVTKEYVDFNQSNRVDGVIIRGLAFYQGDLIFSTIPTLHDREFGLYRYDFDSDKTTTLKKGVYAMRMILIEETGQILYANNSELFLYDMAADTIKQIEIAAGVGWDIRCLIQDANTKQVWVCIDGKGLGLYDTKQQTLNVYPWTEHKIKSAVADDHGNIWLGTKEGLVKFDSKTEKFKLFRNINKDSEMSFIASSAIKLPSGAILMGGLSRLLYFNPQDIKTDNRLLQTRITELKVLNQVEKPQP
ncbi:MAG: hypothetical protein MJK04_05475, partial [Psychrosphaera sp.]|nr:hypothetical protein [Psychrosphaera sp.]